MKAKDLESLLHCDPEADLYFQFGEDDLYRRAVCKMIAEQPIDLDFREDVTPMLEDLEISDINFDVANAGITITLKQGYIQDSCIKGEVEKIRKQRKEAKHERDRQ